MYIYVYTIPQYVYTRTLYMYGYTCSFTFVLQSFCCILSNNKLAIFSPSSSLYMINTNQFIIKLNDNNNTSHL